MHRDTLSTHLSLSFTNVSLMGWHIFISDFLSRNAHTKMIPNQLKHQQSPWSNVGSLWPFHDVSSLSTCLQGAGTGEHLGFAKPTADMLLLLSMCSGNNRAWQEQPKCCQMYWKTREITPEHRVYPEKHKWCIEQKAAPADPHVKVSLALLLFHVFLQLLLLKAAPRPHHNSCLKHLSN